MVNQTTVDPNLATMEPSPGSMVGNIAEFGNDFATLVELQANLAAYDAKECISRATWPVVVLVAGTAVILSCLPVLLLGAADLLSTFTRLPIWGSRLAVGGITLVVAAVGTFVAYRLATKSMDSFRRTSEELTRNLSWLKTVLVHSGRAATRMKI